MNRYPYATVQGGKHLDEPIQGEAAQVCVACSFAAASSDFPAPTGCCREHNEIASDGNSPRRHPG
jgi:hypothetical protein